MTTRPVVIDNAQGMLVAGFSGDDAPSVVFPSIVGRPRHQVEGGILVLSNPIEHSIATNWNDMENIWHHTFYNELRIAPKEYRVLLTEAPLNTKYNKEKMAQIMFETFNVAALSIETRELLALYSTGRVTGIVLSIGDEATYTVPIYEAEVLSHAVQRLDIGKNDIDEYMAKILTERGYSLTTVDDTETVADIVDKLAYVALEFEIELAKSLTYTLPDGEVITIGNERFRATEVLFDPTLIGMEQSGVHKMIFNSIMKSDFDFRKHLYGNIVVAGIGSIFEGLKERLEKEVNDLAPESVTIHVIAPRERKYSTWIGGSIMSSLSAYDERWITKDAYDKDGPSVVHGSSAKKDELYILNDLLGDIGGVHGDSYLKVGVEEHVPMAIVLLCLVLVIGLISVWICNILTKLQRPILLYKR